MPFVNVKSEEQCFKVYEERRLSSLGCRTQYWVFKLRIVPHFFSGKAEHAKTQTRVKSPQVISGEEGPCYSYVSSFMGSDSNAHFARSGTGMRERNEELLVVYTICYLLYEKNLKNVEINK